uniref:Ig-like domain-containing protein n=1 Tax=Seriola dumerili TaxID=41447 RepID=A0A3B4VJL1_SERDU
IKMDQKWIQILVILVFYQQMASGADKKAKDGDEVEIKCAPTQTSSMVMWFRVLDNSDMDYIASFDINGNLKSGTSLKTVFNNNNMKKNILTLKSFSKSRDSGLYCCATLVKNVLVFGETTRLSGGGKSDMFCSPIILGPLAGGCGLLLLLLIIITFYCNRKFILNLHLKPKRTALF